MLEQYDKLTQEEQDMFCRALADRNDTWVGAWASGLVRMYVGAANEKSRLWREVCRLNGRLRGRRRPSDQGARLLSDHEAGKSYARIAMDRGVTKEAVRSSIRAERKRRAAIKQWQADTKRTRQFLRDRGLDLKTQRPTRKGQQRGTNPVRG
jgi:hypothetical protein